MKYAKLVVVLVVISSVILWCRRSLDIGHIARTLPFSGGHRPGIYDIGAIVVLLLLLRGLSRLRSRNGQGDEMADSEDYEPEEDPDDEYYPYEDDDDDNA